jgi:F-type H+-transporting ATPase subunit a
MNKDNGIRKYTLIFILAVMGLFSHSNLYAAGEEQGHGEEDFNAGRMILGHIVDSYGWHLMDIGDKSITIDLPIILYDEGEWHLFMSSKFHHGHDSYKGFKIAQEGINKGKIVNVKPGTMKEDESAGLPVDFSITKNVAAMFFSFLLISFLFIYIAKRYKKHTYEAPKGIQSLLEPLILFVRDDIAKSSIGEKRYQKFMPYLLTVFFFIFINNLLGLVPIAPGGAIVTGNIAVTFVLAMFTFVITNAGGTKGYWKHIFDTPGVPWFLKLPLPLMPIVELLGVFTKPFALLVRLFANITAGHIVKLGFVSLIFIFSNLKPEVGFAVTPFSVLLGVFISMLELLVAFIQAFVFTLLSALFFGMSQEEAH